MLVIISDIHLADGTTGANIPARAFKIFQERLEDMAMDASWRKDKQYRPIEKLDVVLLGDIFDVIRSTRWTAQQVNQAGYARPWSPAADTDLANKVQEITQAILSENKEGLNVLRELATKGIKIPTHLDASESEATHRQNRMFKELQTVKVNIHYMLGNHDWFYLLEGPVYTAIREQIVQAAGLANDPARPFPHEIPTDSALEKAFKAHRVFARHGDRYDSINFPANSVRAEASFGDVLVVELFNLLPAQIESALQSQGVAPEFFALLKEMGSIRPTILTPIWIAHLMDRFALNPDQRKHIESIWRAVLKDFRQLDVLKQFDKSFQPDVVDALQIALPLLEKIPLSQIDDMARALDKLSRWFSKESFDFERAADREQPGWDARFVVYGHTHGFKVYPLRAANPLTNQGERIYINSGTWHPVHEIAYADKQGFITHKTMSYVGFYQDDERSGRAFETWTGTLDI